MPNWCIDCSGNGESGGEFEFGNYWKEVEDLRSVVGFVREVKKRSVKAIVGHSKGKPDAGPGTPQSTRGCCSLRLSLYLKHVKNNQHFEMMFMKAALASPHRRWSIGSDPWKSDPKGNQGGCTALFRASWRPLRFLRFFPMSLPHFVCPR